MQMANFSAFFLYINYGSRQGRNKPDQPDNFIGLAVDPFEELVYRKIIRALLLRLRTSIEMYAGIIQNQTLSEAGIVIIHSTVPAHWFNYEIIQMSHEENPYSVHFNN
jgi:hypothetical protein